MILGHEQADHRNGTGDSGTRDALDDTHTGEEFRTAETSREFESFIPRRSAHPSSESLQRLEDRVDGGSTGRFRVETGVDQLTESGWQATRSSDRWSSPV
jgi:hypothetical protein